MEGEGELKQIQTEVPLLTSLTPYHYAKPAHNYFFLNGAFTMHVVTGSEGGSTVVCC